MKKMTPCFYWFRSGQFISTVGSFSGMIGMSWWVLNKTGSPETLGILMSIPMILDTIIDPLMAPIADRFSRKQLMVAGDIWTSLCWLILSVYAVLGYYSTTFVIGFYCLQVLGSSLFSVAASSVTRMLVEESQLEMAFRQTQILHHGGIIFGGLLGGSLVQMIGEPIAFGINAFSFLAAAMCSLMIRRNTKPCVSNEKFDLQAWGKSLKEGGKLAWMAKPLRIVLIFSAVVAFFEASLQVSLPVLVKNAHGMGESFFGLLRSSSAAGIVLAAISFGWIQKRLGGVLTSMIGCLLASFGIIFLPLSSIFLLPFFMMFFYGFGEILSSLPVQVKLGTAIPINFQSRIGSLIGLLSGCAGSLGIFCCGFVIERIGIHWTLGLAGIGMLVCCLLLFMEGTISKLISDGIIFDKNDDGNNAIASLKV